MSTVGAQAQLRLPSLGPTLSPIARAPALQRLDPDAALAPVDLATARLDAVKALARAHRRELARDPAGELIVQAEVLAPEEAGEHVGYSETGSREIRLSIDKAMGRLPEEQRMAVSLVLVEGLPYKEAAQVLDIPIGTLTSRLARGRDALQAMLGDGDITP